LAVAACRPIFQDYIDRQCEQNLMAARASWAASPNANGAARAGAFLSILDPSARCFGDAITLYNEIKTSTGEDWKFILQNYDPRAIELERINAIREIGVAWGNGQQPVVTNIFTRIR